MNGKRALITGVTGQDGAYLSELLLEKGYEVYGIKRRTSLINTDRIDHLYDNPNFHLHYGDLTDTTNIIRLIKETKPDEIYNLGAMSHVKVSFEMPEYTANVDGLGILRILEAVRLLDMEKTTRIYQASTSELFGNASETPQNESTPFQPCSPYGCAKLFAYWTVVNYREAYGMYACNGILFNHESPKRGETFVTRKITRAVARIVLGLQDVLELGNLDVKRDWGHAKDYVLAMWKMLQLKKPHDFVIATGATTTIRAFVRLAFEELGIQIEFKGKGLKERAVLKYDVPEYGLKRGAVVLKINPKHYRPTDVNVLIGNASKANLCLQWHPKSNCYDLIKEMIRHDLTEAKNEMNYNQNKKVI